MLLTIKINSLKDAKLVESLLNDSKLVITKFKPTSLRPRKPETIKSIVIDLINHQTNVGLEEISELVSYYKNLEETIYEELYKQLDYVRLIIKEVKNGQ